MDQIRDDRDGRGALPALAGTVTSPLHEDGAQSDPANNPAILAVGRALPENFIDQETITAALRDFWTRRYGDQRRLPELHRAVAVEGRYLALPLSEYPKLDTFAKCNQAWQRAAAELGATAVSSALSRAGVEPRDIDHIFFTTTTGIATPSIDVGIINRLGMRRDIKRTPLFGLGCVAGAAGIARASEYLRAFPGQIALVLSVELCSLTLQRNDLSLANFIASGLFGDGAAAAVLTSSTGSAPAGGPHPPRIIATRSALYPDTEDLMGWDIVESGFKIVLSRKVPSAIRDNLAADVDSFLAAHGLTRARIRHFVAHTGGPAVLEAIEAALELPADTLARSWESLRKIGNLSSASVLFVLGDALDAGVAQPGDLGLLMGMGPGFCAELVLLQW